MRIVIAIFLTFLCSFPGAIARADTFTALAPPYPPFSVRKGLTVEGVSVSALSTIMEMCGQPLSATSYKLTPWAHAYESTTRTSKQIVLNANRTAQNAHLYKWVGPIIHSRIVLIGRKRDNLFLPNKTVLKHYRIATVRWSRPEKVLISGGIAAAQLRRTPTHVTSLRMLERGDVDLFATNERQAPTLFRSLGMRLDDYAVYCLYEEEPLYFAFSLDTADSLITDLNRVLKELKTKEHTKQAHIERILPLTPLSMKK